MNYKYLCPFCHNEVQMPLYSPVFGEEENRPLATCKHCNLTLPVFVWMKLFEGDKYKEEHNFETLKPEDPTYEEKEITDYEETYGITSHHEYNPAYATCPFCGCRHEVRNIDLWNGINCPCGALLKEHGKIATAKKEIK